VYLVKPLVVNYRPSWPVEAEGLIADLLSELGNLADRIDHIGSTAIEAMASKNVLDIQLSVYDLDALKRFRSGLFESLGFELSQIKLDHIPAGRLDNSNLWSKRLWLRRIDGAIDVNLHVRLAGSPNERLALLFRDWFRAHPEAVVAYGQFKLALSQLCDDTATYSDTKDPIVDVIAVAAEEWAAAIGWNP
ncbi:unnamed protein product, partial [Acidithrix sp. C25]